MSFLLSDCKELDYSSLLAVNGGCDFSSVSIGGVSIGITGKLPEIRIPAGIPGKDSPEKISAGGETTAVNIGSEYGTGYFQGYGTNVGVARNCSDGGFFGTIYIGKNPEYTGENTALVKVYEQKPLAALIDVRKVVY